MCRIALLVALTLVALQAAQSVTIGVLAHRGEAAALEA